MRLSGGGDWVTMGHSTYGGLLDMGREKNGRSVTWVIEGGRGRKREEERKRANRWWSRALLGKRGEACPKW